MGLRTALDRAFCLILILLVLAGCSVSESPHSRQGALGLLIRVASFSDQTFPVEQVIEYDDGLYYVATEKGLFRVVGRRLQPIHRDLAGRKIRRIVRGDNNRIWYISKSDIYYSDADGPLSKIKFESASSDSSSFDHAIFAFGRLWIASTRGILHVDEYGKAEWLSERSVTTIEEIDGLIHVGGIGFIGYVNPADRQFSLSIRAPVSAYEDYDCRGIVRAGGRTWFVGVYRNDQTEAPLFYLKSDGSLGTFCASLQNLRATAPASRALCKAYSVGSIGTTAWFSTTEGVFWQDGKGFSHNARFAQYSDNAGQPDEVISTFQEVLWQKGSRKGKREIWLGGSQRIYQANAHSRKNEVIEPGTFSPIISEGKNLGTTDMELLGGSLWIWSYSGLYLYDPDTIYVVRPRTIFGIFAVGKRIAIKEPTYNRHGRNRFGEPDPSKLQIARAPQVLSPESQAIPSQLKARDELTIDLEDYGFTKLTFVVRDDVGNLAWTTSNWLVVVPRWAATIWLSVTAFLIITLALSPFFEYPMAILNSRIRAISGAISGLFPMLLPLGLVREYLSTRYFFKVWKTSSDESSFKPRYEVDQTRVVGLLAQERVLVLVTDPPYCRELARRIVHELGHPRRRHILLSLQHVHATAAAWWSVAVRWWERVRRRSELGRERERPLDRRRQERKVSMALPILIRLGIQRSDIREAALLQLSQLGGITDKELAASLLETCRFVMIVDTTLTDRESFREFAEFVERYRHQNYFVICVDQADLTRQCQALFLDCSVRKWAI